MPSRSDCPDTKNRDTTEESTSVGGEVGQANDFERVGLLYPTHDCTPRRLRDHVRIVILEAEVALLERERATLQEENTILEADVESLEKEVATLEETVECKDRRLQQVIDQYERITTANNRTDQRRNEELESTSTGSDRWSLSSIRSFGNEAIAWLKRVVTD